MYVLVHVQETLSHIINLICRHCHWMKHLRTLTELIIIMTISHIFN